MRPVTCIEKCVEKLVVTLQFSYGNIFFSNVPVIVVDIFRTCLWKTWEVLYPSADRLYKFVRKFKKHTVLCVLY